MVPVRFRLLVDSLTKIWRVSDMFSERGFNSNFLFQLDRHPPRLDPIDELERCPPQHRNEHKQRRSEENGHCYGKRIVAGWWIVAMSLEVHGSGCTTDAARDNDGNRREQEENNQSDAPFDDFRGR